MNVFLYVKKNSLENLSLIALLFISYLNFAPFFYFFLIIQIVVFLIKKNYFKISLHFFVISFPFIIALFGLINTSNFNQGLEDIGRLLPFIIFPSYLLLKNKDQWNEQKIIMFIFFILGLILHFVIDIFSSYEMFHVSKNINSFFYTNFDKDTNILSVIVACSSLVLAEFIVIEKNRYKFLFYFISLLILIVFLMFLQSKIAQISLFLGLFFLIIFKFSTRGIAYVLFPVSLMIIIFFIPGFNSRFQTAINNSQIIKFNKNQKDVPKDLSVEDYDFSENMRKTAIEGSISIFKNNVLIGVGTGDWRDELTEWYKLNNHQNSYKDQTAPHNQYLRITLKHGIVGLLYMVIFIFFGIKQAREIKNPGMFSILFILIIAALGYDILDVGTGAPSIAFLLSLFFMSPK
jgi:O-antigen ligase